MSPRTIAPLAAVAFLSPSLASAESLSVTGSGQGIGVELAGVDRSFDINGSSVKAQGALGGLHAFVQQGAGFRAEGRALTGSLDVESSDLASDETSSSHLVDARATWGAATAAGNRLYIGVGVEHLSGDEPFGIGDFSAWSAYVPFGVAGDAPLTDDWHALVTLEMRFLVTGNETLDDVPGIGDLDLDRNAGAGVSLSARFRNVTAGVDIEPFLTYDVTSGTETKTIGGTDTSIDDIQQGTAGVRLNWRL